MAERNCNFAGEQCIFRAGFTGFAWCILSPVYSSAVLILPRLLQAHDVGPQDGHHLSENLLMRPQRVDVLGYYLHLNQLDADHAHQDHQGEEHPQHGCRVTEPHDADDEGEHGSDAGPDDIGRADGYRPLGDIQEQAAQRH